MAVADSPTFPAQEDVAIDCQCYPQILTLQDWQTYFVKFYGESVPDFFPKPEAGLYTQRSFPGQLFEISFRNTVGRTRIGSVSVRVESRKITESRYEEMLSYIADKFSNLVFSFASPLGQNYRKEKAGKDIAYIEYLFLKKYLRDASPNLDGISALILANPHIRLYREFSRCSIDAITNTQPAMLLNMFTASDRFAPLKNEQHPLHATNLGQKIFQKTGKNLYPTEALEERKHLTVDTNENRFVKHFLQTILRRLHGLQKDLKADNKSYLNPDIEQNLDKMTKGIAAFLADPFWHDVGRMVFIPVSSQVLHRREGYRHLFQLYSLLQLTTKCDFFNKDDFENLLETKDTPTLFEYWSFFVVKKVLDDLLKPKSCGAIISVNPLQQHVEAGLCIKYEDNITLWFNKTYSGASGCQPGGSIAWNERSGSYSHNFRPDIVIENEGKLLIFDAKFKGKRGGFYGEDEDGSTFSWKDEDIDKMHCYREAIKGVTGAYILYPGDNEVVYQSHNATGSYEGVGALPLKPEARARPVQQHLNNVRLIVEEFLNLS
ncbi:MAG: DUF2357 domain-containing protein [Geobacteraceae bacterium]|nr:DUF2357 domain-containing protein [Geobacteraceae bacterium]